jgi:SAM-dependent methyltransferase
VVTSGFDGRSYQKRFDTLARQGVDVHGEATFVRSFSPRSVLDAGCGTGRVAIELDRHGIEVVGVDVDPSMIAEARRRAPGLVWQLCDLADLDLGRNFDVVVMAGNVPRFCRPERRRDLVRACAGHVVEGGVLVAGFVLDPEYDVDQYDSVCADAGMDLQERFATWERGRYRPGDRYAVSVHRRSSGVQMSS